MARLAARFHRDQGAQTAILALATMIFMILAVAFPLNIGFTIAKRAKLQNAADAAAYSAAIVQADSLSAIAWLNNMEAYLYHREVEHVLDFCVFGVYGLLDEWNEILKQSNSEDQLSKIFMDPSGTPNKPTGEDWYQDFQTQHGKAPAPFFRQQILGHDAKYIYNNGRRTTEEWIRELRKTGEAIAKALPDMMRHEAMRVAFINMGDDRVRMAVYPGETSNPRLNFDPTAGDDNFLKFPAWHNPDDSRTGFPVGTRAPEGNPFVERAVQIGVQLNAKYLDSNGLVQLPSLGNPTQPWFDIYRGEPTPIGGPYTNYAKTFTCWHNTDKNYQPHSPKPCGHWHVGHTHYHYNCIHWTDEGGHHHVQIPAWHGFGPGDTGDPDYYGYETNVFCAKNSSCFICFTTIMSSMSYYPNKDKELIPGDIPFFPVHHAVRYCPICYTRGEGEFRRSSVADRHGINYMGPTKTMAIEMLHNFGQFSPSKVRCFLADILTQAYANYFDFNVKQCRYHQIFATNFAQGEDTWGNGGSDPRVPRKCPTIVLNDKFYDYGFTVALWFPHTSPFLASDQVYPSLPTGMLAVASAKAGIVMDAMPTPPVTDNNRYFPKRLVAGIGEARRNSDATVGGPYDAGYWRDNFRKTSRKDPILNGFHTNWGAKLVPVDKSCPDGTQALLRALNGQFYRWDGNRCAPTGRPTLAAPEDAWTQKLVH